MYDFFENKGRYLQMEQEAIQGKSKNWTQEQKDFYTWMSNMEEQMSEFGCGGEKE